MEMALLAWNRSMHKHGAARLFLPLPWQMFMPPLTVMANRFKFFATLKR